MIVENYREGPQTDNDKAEATFDVRHNGSRYIDLRLMKSAKGHHFISYPSKPREGADGKKVYHRLYDWGESRNKEFDGLVLEALKPWVRK